MGMGLEKESFHALDPIRAETVGSKLPISFKDLEAQCDTPELQESLQDLLDQCLRYTETILRIRKLVEEGVGPNDSRDGEIDMDELGKIRGATHDATIDTINSFSRALQRAGKDNSWMQKVVSGRASYAKFALLLTIDRVLEDKTAIS